MKRFVMMMMGLGLAAPISGHAQIAAGAKSTPVAAIPADLARAIANLMAPRDLVMGKAEQSFDQQFNAEMAANPGGAAMEKVHPGITAAIRDVARQQLLKAMGEDLPKLSASIAGVFADNFDLAEQRQVYDFLASPAGRRLVAAGDKIYDQDKLRKQAEAAQRSGKKMTGADLASAIDPAATSGFSADDRAALETFVETPGGTKFTAVTPKLQQAMADWLNGLNAAHQEEMKAAISAKVAAFIAQPAKTP